MVRNIIPALAAVCVTIVLASLLSKKQGGEQISSSDMEQAEDKKLPSFIAALAGPVVVIVLLALRPLCGISIDPLIALPVGGVACMLATGQIKSVVAYSEFGLSKVLGVCLYAHIRRC